MASLSTRPNPDHLSHCFTLVRWLHENGISWSGTASELASQLAQDREAQLWFSDADELVAFLESNIDALHHLGLEASIRRFPGRPRLIDLQLNPEEIAPKPVGPIEVVRPPSEDIAVPVIEEKIEPAPPKAEDDYVPLFANKPEPAPWAKNSASNESAIRLFELLGVSAEEPAPKPREAIIEKEQPRFTPFVVPAEDEDLRARFMPLAIAGVVLLLVILTFALVVRNKRETKNAVVVTNPSSTTESVPTPPIDPAEAKKTKALLQQASTSQSPSQQYDLAMRYESGLGVEQDRGTAYAWLTIARANGSTRASSMIRNLGERLSPAEMQKARIIIGKAFASGTSVPRSYVIAHNFFSLAELAGSAEAHTLKKQLESKMTPGQIQRASAQSALR